jgi:type IV pilus assembly protein PilA
MGSFRYLVRNRFGLPLSLPTEQAQQIPFNPGGPMFQLLKARLAERREDREEGFTLIELMVVVLIIAILIAIAIPTFLGARQKAQDRAAQSDLRNALTAAKTIYVDSQDYTSVNAASGGLASVEPSLTYVSGTASTDPKIISVNATSASHLVLAAQSKSGTCFYIVDDTASGSAGTQFGKATGSCVSTTVPGTLTSAW